MTPSGNQNHARLSTGTVRGHLVRMTVPMTGGILAIAAFNLADTYFVSKLGTRALAAMGFIFPVIMVVISVSLGLGLGASTVISRAIGRGSSDEIRRLTTDSILIAVITVFLIGIIGFLTIDPLFRMLGATADTLPLIRSYMTIWYGGVAVLIIPIIGNHCIRATGDTLTPAVIMIVLSAVNIVLDPILIFGRFGIPAMGIAGAALATVLTRTAGMVAALWILHRKYGMIDISIPRLRKVLDSWARILHVSIPAAMTHLLLPISMGIVTRLVSTYGQGPVAAVGAGSRVMQFAYIVPIALGTALVPFVGQNWGANLTHRSYTAWWKSNRFCLYYGLATFLIFYLFATEITTLFSNDPDVTVPMTAFLLIILAASGLQHTAVHSGFTLNAIGYPVTAFFFNLLRMLLLMCPLAFAGNYLFGLIGIFFGVALAQVITGLIGRLTMPVLLRPAYEKQ